MPPPEARLSLLVVDDDKDFLESFRVLLKRKGHVVKVARDLEETRAILETEYFDAILMDELLPDGRGGEILGDFSPGATTEVVLITGNASVSAALEAVRKGALDYLAKPIESKLLDATLLRIQRASRLRREIADLKIAVGRHPRFGRIVTQSSAMSKVFDLIERVAPTDATVFLEGESGTGKELVAHLIHELSSRRQAPLVAVNCGAIPEHLFESELFGHEKGSFTGADRVHRGHFERANGGTLFLDEITDMPVGLQVKLLRVLETGVVQRVGGSEPIPINVRVLAASNSSPVEAVRRKEFRDDLYFRLSVFPVMLPPLRERIGDVEHLAEFFLNAHNLVHATNKTWEPGALGDLAQLEWRGNVRELRNAVQRAFILAAKTLTVEQAIGAVRKDRIIPLPEGLVSVPVGSSIAELEQKLIEATLKHVKGDKSAAAAMLGFSLKTLYARLNVYQSAHS